MTVRDKVTLVTGGASGTGVHLDVTDRASTDAAANITGEALNVSGGQQMH